SPREIVKVDALCKRYVVAHPLLGRASELSAVRNVFFNVGENEFVGLVGESGSGKTTVARLLLGIERASAGRIVLNGRDVTAGSAADAALRVATIQMVFQDPRSALNPRRRIASIVTQAMEAGSRRASWDERLERAKALLAEMGLPADFAPRYPAQLSGGQ